MPADRHTDTLIAILRSNETACADFPTGVVRDHWAATQWYHQLLFAAYGLATAHALLCIVNGMTRQFFVLLSLVTLTFDLDLRIQARFLYIVPNRLV